jgi:flagellar protein FlaI
MNFKNFIKLTIKGCRKKLLKELREEEKGFVEKERVVEKPKIFKVPERYEKIVEKTKIIPIFQPVSLPYTLEEEGKLKKEKKEGIPLPSTLKKPKLVKEEEVKKVYTIYPLIPSKPKPNDYVFAYVKIYFDEKKKAYVYELHEPPLTPSLIKILEEVRKILEERLEVDLSKLKGEEVKEYLKKEALSIINNLNVNLSFEEREILFYYLERDLAGLGKIEALMRDPNIEDISCDGVNIPIFVFHRDPRIGSVETNIKFEDPEELDSFVIRLAQLCGKSISIANPLIDGTLPDGSRVQATLATDIARKGSNFTIRKFTQTPLTPVHLLNFNTLSELALAYLWLAVDYGKNILICGATASGKTTLLNVLSLFIRPERKIVSIEDTAELHLPHTHWVPAVARTIIAEKPGEIDLFELLRESIRQRPDYIIVGEVRGKEAYILFQQMSIGHPALATIHSENMERLVDRLTTKPIELPANLLSSLDIIIFTNRLKYRGNFVRRVTEIHEVLYFDEKSKKPVTNLVFKWNPKKDVIEPLEKSYILKEIADHIGEKEEEILEELIRRANVLKWMKENKIEDFREVYKILNLYYTSPNKLLVKIMGLA